MDWLLWEGDVCGVGVAGHEVDGEGGQEGGDEVVQGGDGERVVGARVIAVFF